MSEDRRKYRFRVWDKTHAKLYPVISMTRGGIVVQAQGETLTCPRESVVLMQFSGLHDTRENEIYEGDIVSLTRRDATTRYEVVFNGGAFRLQPLGDGEAEVLSEAAIRSSGVEVVGNVHELHDQPLI